MAFIIGAKYRIQYTIPPQRKPREAVMRFSHLTATHYFFDARPLAGTQSLPVECVHAIEPSPNNAEIYLNKVVL